MAEKCAVVTGSSRGIGSAVAAELAQNGYGIILNYLNSAESAQQLAQKLSGQYGVACHAIQADVSDFDSAKKLIEAAQQHFGRLDALINNAGITRDALMLRMKEDAFDDVLRINLKSAYNCIRHAAPIMVKQRYGRIVNISSIVARMGNIGQANYCAAKAGLEGMTRACAREFAPRNITVNAIAPGFIQTDMTDNLPENYRDNMQKAIPLGRFGIAGDVAHMAAYLCSDAANYITGQVIAVDGGLGLGGGAS